MYSNLNIGTKVLNGEEVEQAINEVMKILARYELNYDSSIYLLNLVIDAVGNRYFFKD